MKGTDHFKELIKNYLDNRAKEDELFRVKYETTTRTIDDVVNYIFHAVQQSGCCNFRISSSWYRLRAMARCSAFSSSVSSM